MPRNSIVDADMIEVLKSIWDAIHVRYLDVIIRLSIQSHTTLATVKYTPRAKAQIAKTVRGSSIGRDSLGET